MFDSLLNVSIIKYSELWMHYCFVIGLLILYSLSWFVTMLSVSYDYMVWFLLSMCILFLTLFESYGWVFGCYSMNLVVVSSISKALGLLGQLVYDKYKFLISIYIMSWFLSHFLYSCHVINFSSMVVYSCYYFINSVLVISFLIL